MFNWEEICCSCVWCWRVSGVCCVVTALGGGCSVSRGRWLQSSSSVNFWYKVCNICLIFLHLNFPCYKIIVGKRYFITCFDAMNLLHPSQCWAFLPKFWTRFTKRHIYSGVDGQRTSLDVVLAKLRVTGIYVLCCGLTYWRQRGRSSGS